MNDNPYSEEFQPETHRVWEQGWAAGYDDNEADWIRRVLPIVGELEEHIRYDWEHNDCVQVSKIKLIFDTFFEFPPEHDWLETLIQDAVEVQNENGWDLSKGERLDFEVMARAFNLELADAS